METDVSRVPGRVREMQKRLETLARKTSRRFAGRNGQATNGTHEQKRLQKTLRQVESALSDLQERVLRWVETRGNRPSVIKIQRELQATTHAFNLTLADQLDALARQIRRVGSKLDRTDDTEPVARKIESGARRLRGAFRPNLSERLNRTLREHPWWSLGIALGSGYLLYRALS